MLGRSTAVVFMLGFAHAGVLAGCGNSSKGISSGKDAAEDTRSADRDTTPVPDTNLMPDADASRANDSAPDAEPAEDVAGKEVDAMKPDTEPDVLERGDNARDIPPSTDLPAETAAVPDGKALDAPPTSEVGKPADAPAGPDSKSGIDGNLSLSCQGILLDNTFPPETYPVLYREPASANESFTARTSALLSSYGLATSDYTFDHIPVSWAATIQQGNGPCTLDLGGTSSAATFLATARSFLSKWGDLFQYQDNGKESVAPSCDSKFCMVTLAQDYCGLPLRSKEQNYRGDLVFDTYVKDGCLWRAISHFVPMVPIPRNVLLSEVQLKQAIVGLTLTYACATGERSVQVSAQDTFIMPVTPTVLVRESSTVASALEYRLAVGVVVGMGSNSPLAWTIYVDGLDGTVLDSVAGFICD